MKTVFVDTSGFYACLDRTDPFHPQALAAFERAEQESWTLITTNYVMHETWALVQRRLGWEAVEAFLNDLLPRCTIQWVDENLYQAGAARESNRLSCGGRSEFNFAEAATARVTPEFSSGVLSVSLSWGRGLG